MLRWRPFRGTCRHFTLTASNARISGHSPRRAHFVTPSLASRQAPFVCMFEEDSMNGHHPRLGSRLRSLSAAGRTTWRYARWVLAAATVPFALWACNSYPLQLPKPAPEEQTDLLYEVNPVRKLDLVFIVDNSSSMT